MSGRATDVGPARIDAATAAALPSSIVCAGCGFVAADDVPYPFRCPRAGSDDVDHVMTRVIDPYRVRWPDGDDPNPFVRYRLLSHAYHLSIAGGMSDSDYVALVRGLDDAVARVDGHGFRVTPFGPSAELAARLGFGADGAVWVKDETGNVSGSHKARHMMGLLIHLEVLERLGLVAPGDRPPLAIASCGNAALAAAVVARAGERRLQVFVPTDADPVVVSRLNDLQAEVVVCPRDPGVPGDPAYLRLREAVAAGALPFTCQGNENGLSIEGGLTLGYEMASALHSGDVVVDRAVVQVGGGALASAVIQGVREAAQLGAAAAIPRIHTVQTFGAYPLKRAFDLLAERAEDTSMDEALRYAAAHRSEFMWPWEEPPHSVAHGILDDETYDWLAVVRGMAETGGSPLVVDEETLERANELGVSATGIQADHTGTSGLGGLSALRHEGVVEDHEVVAVLFTGRRRSD